MTLRLFECFHEADDQVSCTNIAAKINMCAMIDLQYLNKPLLPSDITCFLTFLTYSKSYLSYLSLYSCYIRDTGLKMIHQVLVTSGVTTDSVDIITFFHHRFWLKLYLLAKCGISFYLIAILLMVWTSLATQNLNNYASPIITCHPEEQVDCSPH